LDKNVSLTKLATITQNYTGAEIEAVVKNACAYAMTKGNNIMDFSKNFTLKKGTTVTMEDFEKAIN
jgi:vesicle-fusing ATPase